MPQRFIVSMGSSTIPDEWTDFRCTNTLYYAQASGAGVAQGLAQAIADAYSEAPDNAFIFGAIQVRAYEFAGSANTGPPIAIATANQAFAVGPGPREVACALSYRAGPSTPRSRGRIFLGPVSRVGTGAGDYVPGVVGGAALALGGKLATINTGGAVWSMYSRRDGVLKTITNTSVDNAWDTQRSRGLPPTANF